MSQTAATPPGEPDDRPDREAPPPASAGDLPDPTASSAEPASGVPETVPPAPTERSIMASAWRRFGPETLRALPFAALLALLLGATLVLGAHLSNGTPSARHPFGWEGPSSFENGVAMVRSDLVLATTLPALLLGALALRGREPSQDDASLASTVVPHGLLLALAPFVAGLGAMAFTFSTKPVSYAAFGVGHAALALVFYSFGLLASATLRRAAVPAALGAWAVFVLYYEGAVRLAMYRLVGYHEILAGNFPTWFYVAQGLSPLSAYRGILILWQPDFRDFLERAALQNAALPGWMNPVTFVGLTLVWALVPLLLAIRAWRRRARAPAPPSPRRDPEAA